MQRLCVSRLLSLVNDVFSFSSLGLLLLCLCVERANAQSLVVSATAAWSSQIVAFWGAIFIGVAAAQDTEISNGVTSVASNITAFRRAHKIQKALSAEDWFLASGLDNGRTRCDIVLLSWRSTSDLRRLSLQVSMQIETLGRTWEVLVCGRRLRNADSISSAQWIQSPRIPAFCAARITETSGCYFPIDERIASEACGLLRGGIPVEGIVQYINSSREIRASRCTYITEARSEMQEVTTLARFFTTFSKQTIPFVRLQGTTGQYGNGRTITLKCASRMYFIFHVTMSIAVGLMSVASGRGLAVWLMAARSALASLSTKGIVGRDAMMTFLNFDETTMQYETTAGSLFLAGDLAVGVKPRKKLFAAFGLSVLEVLLLGSGWLYGALHVERLRPRGVVGHGMLWLAILVGIALSTRAMFGLQRRASGRLIGIFRTQEHVRYVPGRSTTVHANLLKDLAQPSGILYLAATLLRDCANDSNSICSASSILRRPEVGITLNEHLAIDIMKYQYEGDAIVGVHDSKVKMSAATSYPWRQAAFCNALTAVCACVSALYAYTNIPSWIKPVIEVVLAISATWYASLTVSNSLPHDVDSFTCHMVATMVVSAVWYVGVRDVG